MGFAGFLGDGVGCLSKLEFEIEILKVIYNICYIQVGNYRESGHDGEQ